VAGCGARDRAVSVVHAASVGGRVNVGDTACRPYRCASAIGIPNRFYGDAAGNRRINEATYQRHARPLQIRFVRRYGAMSTVRYRLSGTGTFHFSSVSAVVLTRTSVKSVYGADIDVNSRPVDVAYVRHVTAPHKKMKENMASMKKKKMKKKNK